MNPVYWYGGSRIAYGFYLYPVGTEFIPASAVYMLCRAFVESGVVKYGALYVGEAESLYDRLNADVAAGRHDGYKRAEKHGLSHIGLHFIAGNADRFSIETDLRHGVKPICNREPVPSSLSLMGSYFTKV